MLILGSGTVARGVVEAAIERTWPAIWVAGTTVRNPVPLHPHLTCLGATLASDADGVALAERVRALARPLAGVIATTPCTPPPGRVLDHAAETLREELSNYLLPQLIAARHLLPLLSASGRAGSYVLIGGPGNGAPWAGYGRRSIAAAALEMLALVLREEARSLAIRVQLLSVEAPVRGNDGAPHACDEWPLALDVGHHALQLIERSNPAEAAVAVVRHGRSARESVSRSIQSARHVEDEARASTSSGRTDPR